MEKGIDLKKIKETEIIKRFTAPLPPWWKKVQMYAGITFIIAGGVLGAAPVIGISAAGITIIQIIMSMSGAISGLAQFAKK